MAIKKFTFFNLARDLENLAPGFGITIDYEILEGLIRAAKTTQPPDHLRDDLKELAEAHECIFKDMTRHKFVHFAKAIS